MAATIGAREREILEAPNFAHVATLRADGSPHGVLVWVDVEGDRVVLNSSEGRDWPENLKRDPRVSLTVPNSENPYETVVIRGRVAEATHEGADEHIDKMAKKYLGQDEYPYRQPGEQRVKIVVEPERVQVQGG
jgi:PPOX class probable F420-dependent enzyme